VTVLIVPSLPFVPLDAELHLVNTIIINNKKQVEEMSKTSEANIVWIVSFQIDETGRFLDYEIDQLDLHDHPEVGAKLTTLIGKGVFTSAEEAKVWAEKQFASRSGCSGCGCGGCCHEK
jgi:hypothetical protein